MFLILINGIQTTISNSFHLKQTICQIKYSWETKAHLCIGVLVLLDCDVVVVRGGVVCVHVSALMCELDNVCGFEGTEPVWSVYCRAGCCCTDWETAALTADTASLDFAWAPRSHEQTRHHFTTCKFGKG